MSCISENLDACVPITAIQVLQFPRRKLVLSGHGPYINVTDDDTGRALARCRIFERNNIHGIQILDHQSPSSKYPPMKIFVWGGQSLRVLEIEINNPETEWSTSLLTISDEFVCPDWILDSSFRAVHEDNLDSASSYTGCLITAHNVVLGVELQIDPVTREVSFRLHEIAPELKPVLYSADIIWTSPQNILVAAGTVFGEIIVWTCCLEPGTGGSSFSSFSIHVHHFFTGHEGSIFGVNISEEVQFDGESFKRRFLASCSDDRTIRIWDISSTCSPLSGKHGDVPRHRLPRSTGFGTYDTTGNVPNQEACVAKTMGHSSRIWGVYFLDVSPIRDSLAFNLISRGEDATCQLWSLQFRKEKNQNDRGLFTGLNIIIMHTSTHTYHTGKNIWSLTFCKDYDKYGIYSGGADGKLVSFSLDRKTFPLRILGEVTTEFSADEVVNSLGLRDAAIVAKSKKPSKLSCYTFVTNDSLVAVTDRGEVLLGQVLTPPSGTDSFVSNEQISWKFIQKLGGVWWQCLSAGNLRQHVAIIGSVSGSIWLYRHSSNHMEQIIQSEPKLYGIYMVEGLMKSSNASNSAYTSFITAHLGDSRVRLFTVKIQPDIELVSDTFLNLPPTFLVTTAFFMEATNWLFLGSRHGGIAIYDLSCGAGEIGPVVEYPHLHNNDSVTSIFNLQEPKKEPWPTGHIITTGRDGYYQIHVVEQKPSDTGTIILRTVHKACPPFGPNIEGGFLDSKSNDLILYGFNSVYFITWNESIQKEIMAAECGGCHRMWAFHGDGDGRGILLWTKASRLRLFSSQGASHRVLRSGGHGREIKTSCLSTLSSHSRQVLVTGAEDTTLRFFIPDCDEKFRCQMTLKRHTAGTQHVQFSPPRDLLFSSSGREELYIWRISHISGFGIGAMFLGEFPKSKPVTDLRITHFDILKLDDSDTLLVALAYSNSTVKLFLCEPTPTGVIVNLVAQGQYSTNCITHIRFVWSKNHLTLLTTSTDGYLALWELTSSLASTLSIRNGCVKRNSDYDFQKAPIELECGYRHLAHQSSIKAMEIIRISETDLLVCCGGDDNCLTVSRISPKSSSSEGALWIISLSLPQAHASAINAVAALSEIQAHDGGFDVMIASSGNDQRVKIWNIRVDHGKGAGSMVISKKKDLYTPIADVSSMQVLVSEKNGNRGQHLVICGVGMDLWEVEVGC